MKQELKIKVVHTGCEVSVNSAAGETILTITGEGGSPVQILTKGGVENKDSNTPPQDESVPEGLSSVNELLELLSVVKRVGLNLDSKGSSGRTVRGILEEKGVPTSLIEAFWLMAK